MDEVDPFAMASDPPAEVPVVFARDPAPDPMRTVGLEFAPALPVDVFAPPAPVEPARPRLHAR